MEETRGPFSPLLAQNRENKVRVGDTVLVLYTTIPIPLSVHSSIITLHLLSAFILLYQTLALHYYFTFIILAPSS